MDGAVLEPRCEKCHLLEWQHKYLEQAGMESHEFQPPPRMILVIGDADMAQLIHLPTEMAITHVQRVNHYSDWTEIHVRPRNRSTEVQFPKGSNPRYPNRVQYEDWIKFVESQA